MTSNQCFLPARFSRTSFSTFFSETKLKRHKPHIRGSVARFLFTHPHERVRQTEKTSPHSQNGQNRKQAGALPSQDGTRKTFCPSFFVFHFLLVLEDPTNVGKKNAGRQHCFSSSTLDLPEVKQKKNAIKQKKCDRETVQFGFLRQSASHRLADEIVKALFSVEVPNPNSTVH